MVDFINGVGATILKKSNYATTANLIAKPI